MAFTAGLGKGRKVEKGDVIEGVISEGVDNDELIVGDTATPCPELPLGTTVLIVHNDSGKFVRYGGPDVQWAPEGDVVEPSVPKRGFPIPNGKGFSIGLADQEANKIFFICAPGQTAKMIVGPGV